MCSGPALCQCSSSGAKRKMPPARMTSGPATLCEPYALGDVQHLARRAAIPGRASARGKCTRNTWSRAGAGAAGQAIVTPSAGGRSW